MAKYVKGMTENIQTVNIFTIRISSLNAVKS